MAEILGPFACLDSDELFDVSQFTKDFSITVRSSSDECVQFEMKGIAPPLANAFRRILIAEVPTVAISQITMEQNTGVIPDEYLAHRMGLIPIVIDPDLLQWRLFETDEFNENNSIDFKLRKSCDHKTVSVPVYSGDLIWKPSSAEQAEKFKNNPPHPVVDDILIAKLCPGQEIDLVCRCEKGLGKDHAKWSPVCTAYYRLVPVIELAQDIVGDDAVRLRDACPPGVIKLTKGKDGKKKAEVADPAKLNVHRECLEPFRELGVTVTTSRDHYFFSIETVGHVPATTLFEKAIMVLKEKCVTARKVLGKRK